MVELDSVSSPEPAFSSTPAAAIACSLCDALLEPGAARCPNCGLWAGGSGPLTARGTLLRVGVVFAAIYFLALVAVAAAR